MDLLFQRQKEIFARMQIEREIDWSQEEWVQNLLVAMEDEISEVRRETNWKWWKNPKPIDVPALKGEVTDLWLFLVQMTIVVGITPDELQQLYLEKISETNARQDGTSDRTGYEINK